MIKYFILLLKLNMPAHYNDGLPHKEHEKPTEQSQDKYNETGKNYHLDAGQLYVFNVINEFFNCDIIGWSPLGFIAWKAALNEINDIAHDLGLQYVEVV